MTGSTKQFASKGLIVVLSLASVTLLTFWTLALYRQFGPQEVVIAAGPDKSDSLALMQALKVVVTRHHPRIRVTVRQSGGTEDNLKQLEQGRAQLAVSQVDVAAPRNARTVSVLFQDVFQLVVRRTEDKTQPVVSGFEGLKGKNIGLAKDGPQYKAFLFVASQFGLKDSDFTFVGGNNAIAAQFFERNEADAVFRIQPVLSADISRLLAGGGATLLPISVAQALQARNPAYTGTTIPKAVYADTASPVADVPTIQTARVLLASEDVDAEVVSVLSDILATRHLELAEAMPPQSDWAKTLAAGIKRPSGVVWDAPLHPGAEPGFRNSQAASVLNPLNLRTSLPLLAILVALWVLELRREGARLRRRRSDAYIATAANLKVSIAEAEDQEAIISELRDLYPAALRDLRNGKMSGEGFEVFQNVWKSSMEAVGVREGGPEPKSFTASVRAKVGQPDLFKYLQPK